MDALAPQVGMSLPPVSGICIADIPGLGAIASVVAMMACLVGNHIVFPTMTTFTNCSRYMDDAYIVKVVVLWFVYFFSYVGVYALFHRTRKLGLELMHILLSVMLASMEFNYCADLLGFVFAILFFFFPGSAMAAVVVSAVLYGVVLAVFYLGSYYVIELARDRCISAFGGPVE